MCLHLAFVRSCVPALPASCALRSCVFAFLRFCVFASLRCGSSGTRSRPGAPLPRAASQTPDRTGGRAAEQPLPRHPRVPAFLHSCVSSLVCLRPCVPASCLLLRSCLLAFCLPAFPRRSIVGTKKGGAPKHSSLSSCRNCWNDVGVTQARRRSRPSTYAFTAFSNAG